MSAARHWLEDFDSARTAAAQQRQSETDAAIARARGEGHAAGYAEGFAAAMAAAEAEDRAAVIALRESVQDIELTQAGARAEAVAKLRPLVMALARVAAPHAAAQGFAALLADAVERRLMGAPDAALVARVAPERVEGVALRLDDRVAVRADPALEGARARLEWAGGGVEIDVEGCLAAARSAIERFFVEADQGARHVG